MPTVHTNNFIKRQTTDSRFSHTTKSMEELAAEVLTNIDMATPSTFQPLALEVPIDPAHCRTSIVTLEANDKLRASFEVRRTNESPRKVIEAQPGTVQSGQKIPAQSAYVVLFPSTLLSETGDNELEPVDGNWEMISLNASPTTSDTPIAPDTLMHNHFGSDGGTATGLSDADFVAALRESFTFWKDKAMLGGE